MSLRHLVLLRFSDHVSAEKRAELEAAFCRLPEKIAEVQSLEWGTNVSPEGLSKGFTHCFSLSFAGERERDAYLPHPAHLAFVESLKPCLADVLVIDYVA